MFRGFGILILIIPVVLVAAAVYFYGFATRDLGSGKVLIDDKKFNVEIADTILTRQQGLSGREKLGKNEGMLFVFGGTAVHRFWMKDMLIPIDIIWIQGKEVIGFTEKVYPEPGVRDSELTIYKPPAPVNLVLEVSAGTVERMGIKGGDSVFIRL